MSVKIEFISEGFRQILSGDGVKRLVDDSAAAIQQRAGEGFYKRTEYGNYGGGRWVGYVGAETKDAMIAESENKVLSGAVY